MSKRSSLLLVTLLLGCVLEVAWAQGPSATGSPEARLATYDSSTGETFFALSLTAPPAPPAQESREIVILFDTSASQTGLYRSDALAALKALLGQLGDADRVQLMAADLNAVSLSDGFVAPRGAEMDAALAKLEQRTPLGSTDLTTALKTAADTFGKTKPAASTVVYFGDGVSRAQPIQADEFAAVTQTLVQRRVPVTSLAIGPQRDVALLAALANQTGGNLFVDTDDVTAQQAGAALAKAVQAHVFWPVDTKLPAAMADAYPKTMPPLRSDRDSILIGVLKERQPQLIAATLEVNGKQIEKSWTVPAEGASPDFSFLPQLINLARRDGGLTLPTAGSNALHEAARIISTSAEDLAKLGGDALRSGDVAAARTAVEEALARDPNNPQVLALRNLVQKASEGKLPASTAVTAAAAPELQLGPAPAPAAPATPAAPAADLLDESGGTFLDRVEASAAVQSEVIQTEVEQGLNQARQRMATDPALVRQDLKLLLESLDRAADLRPEVRSQLRDRIEALLREAQRREVESEDRLALAQENRVVALDTMRLADETARKRLKIKQLLDRFNYLLAENKYQAAEVDVAEQVRTVEPNLPDATVALWNARNLKNVEEMVRFRDLRHRAWIDTLYQVEKSATPFPDEPPIVYPDAEVWEQLSISRKKYATVDLGGPAGLFRRPDPARIGKADAVRLSRHATEGRHRRHFAAPQHPHPNR